MLPQRHPVSPLDRRQIAASFTGGDITFHAGFLLLRAIIQNTGLAKKATNCLNDNRRQTSVQHQTETLLTQRGTRRTPPLVASSAPPAIRVW
jgi:hypothetical protein